MKFKYLSILAIVIMLCFSFQVVSENVVKINNSNHIGTNEFITIKVALYTDENEDYFFEFLSAADFFYALDDYSWIVGNKEYSFDVDFITSKDIYRGKLNIENYDVLLYPPDTADEYLINTGFSRLLRNKLRVRNIREFIEDGGGYYGSCGSALIAVNMINEPETFLERAMKKSCMGLSCAYVDFHGAIPILNQLSGKSYETTDTQAYLLFSGWNTDGPHGSFMLSGASLDAPIFNDHPIFDDYLEETRRIRWIGAPNIYIPETPDRKISVLATYPDEEICENESIDVHYWKFTGNLLDLIKGQLFGKGDIHWCENLGFLMRSFVFSTDWEKTDSIVKTNFSNKPFMTAEEYPNENLGRIVICTGHPELEVWWGGHIEEVEDTDENNIYDALHHWVDVTPYNETIEDELSYNYWIIRRSIAWAAKIPDDALPPVYGTSQVCDINSEDSKSEIVLYGNSKTSDGIVELELYYRHSADNETWSDWALYSTDTNGEDGWSWNFAFPNCNGYYQFYSKRHVYYLGYEEIETDPPGPDAMVYVDLE